MANDWHYKEEPASFKSSRTVTFCSLAATASAPRPQRAYPTADTTLACSDPKIPDPKWTFWAHNPAPSQKWQARNVVKYIRQTQFSELVLRVSPRYGEDQTHATVPGGVMLTCSWVWSICWSRHSHIRKQDENHPILCPFYVQWTLESLYRPCWGRKSRTEESRVVRLGIT